MWAHKLLVREIDGKVAKMIVEYHYSNNGQNVV